MAKEGEISIGRLEGMFEEIKAAQESQTLTLSSLDAKQDDSMKMLVRHDEKIEALEAINKERADSKYKNLTIIIAILAVGVTFLAIILPFIFKFR